MDCLFCKIIEGDVPSSKVFENESVYAFRDINPQAPVHVIVVPKKHVEGMHAVNEDNDLQSLMLACAEVARIEGLERNGYRLVINTGRDAGQTIFHLHVHVLGGRPMSWPPG
ncbi:MAG TPA: histidine triad nucleotide-binding protein [Fimbriimonadales bacterium]|nr:histidine triad nucleotide-binding protein [Fimbriimonadales bacterium]